MGQEDPYLQLAPTGTAQGESWQFLDTLEIGPQGWEVLLDIILSPHNEGILTHEKLPIMAEGKVTLVLAEHYDGQETPQAAITSGTKIQGKIHTIWPAILAKTWPTLMPWGSSRPIWKAMDTQWCCIFQTRAGDTTVRAIKAPSQGAGWRNQDRRAGTLTR